MSKNSQMPLSRASEVSIQPKRIEEGREVGGRWGMLVGQDAGVRNNTSHTEEQRSGRLQEIAKEIQGNNRKNDVPASIHEENIEGPQAEITKAEILEATPLTPEEHVGMITIISEGLRERGRKRSANVRKNSPPGIIQK